MYAVIQSGGKQERVTVGQTIQVERLAAGAGEEVSFTPVLIVDGASVVAGAGALGRASVSGRVLGEVKGPKVTGFTYKPKTNNRRRWGHRQRYTAVEITAISPS